MEVGLVPAARNTKGKHVAFKGLRGFGYIIIQWRLGEASTLSPCACLTGGLTELWDELVRWFGDKCHSSLAC